MTAHPAYLAALAALFAATRAPAQQPPPDSVIYVLSPQSRLDVHTRRAGIFGGLGHEHLVRARAFAGTVVHFGQAPEHSSVSVTVRTDSLEILTDAAPSDIAKMTRAMREKTLRVEQFPEITFVSREVAAIEGGLRVTGDFTMAGRTRPLTVDVALEIAGDTLRAVARFPLRQTDFGIKPYGTAFGTVKVADEVEFEIGVVATAAR